MQKDYLPLWLSFKATLEKEKEKTTILEVLSKEQCRSIITRQTIIRKIKLTSCMVDILSHIVLESAN